MRDSSWGLGASHTVFAMNGVVTSSTLARDVSPPLCPSYTEVDQADAQVETERIGVGGRYLPDTNYL